MEKDFKYSKWWYVIGILFAANLAAYTLLARASGGDHATVYFFDVGQGDSIYIRTAAGNDVLIDGGPGDAVLSKLGKAMPFNDRTIEFMILTHPHADHASGLVEVLKRYEVKNLMTPQVQYDSATYQKFLELASQKKVKVFLPKLGQRVYFDDQIVFDVYYPVAGRFSEAPKDVNEVSIVGKVSFGSQHILLTGDSGKGTEDLLLGLKIPLEAQILKVGHQGSKTSSGKLFIEKVRPDYSVIMVGKNSYGHPHEEVLGLLSAQQTRVLRTDEHGDVVFRLYSDHVLVLPGGK